MDKIRDILFGNQVRDFDKRFSRMEAQLIQKTDELQEETHKRLDSLENFIKKETELLRNRLRNESDDRAKSEKKLADEFGDTTSELRKKIRQIDIQIADTASELHEQVLSQSKKLSDDIKAKFDQADKNLKEAGRTLDDAKVDRSALAEFLIEMAMGVSGKQLSTRMQDAEES